MARRTRRRNYQRARASRMEYYKEKDTIVLLGNAVYGQGGDKVAADRIDYDSKNSRMKARTMTASKKNEGRRRRSRRRRAACASPSSPRRNPTEPPCRGFDRRWSGRRAGGLEDATVLSP